MFFVNLTLTIVKTQINEKIERELKPLMDQFNVEKGKYDKLTEDREQLNTQYKELKDKFQNYLDEIEAGDKKSKMYTEEIQTLQSKIMELRQENLNMLNDMSPELKAKEMDDYIAHTKKKIETFTKLKEDLQKKLG